MTPETNIYDVIVIGTGAGGGMAIHTLTQAGLKVCALNAGRELNPMKDFRAHKMAYDLPYRGFGSPERRAESVGYMDSEFVTRDAWEHEIEYSTAAGTKYTWPRSNAVGGKTNFWGRSSARMGEIDFKAASLDGVDVDWPISYHEIAPFYSRVERMIGVASTVQNRPSNPDGEYLPPINFRYIDLLLLAGAKKMGLPYVHDRLAQLTQPHGGHPACHFCGNCTNGCDVGAFFSSPYFLLPDAKRSGNFELRTNAVARAVLVDEAAHAKGVAYVDRTTRQEVEVYAKAVVVSASCLATAQILLNSRSRHWPTGIANSSGQVGKNLCDQLYGHSAIGYFPQLLGRPSFPDNVSNNGIAWMPRWQNLAHPNEEGFVRGYALYPGGGCADYPGYADDIEGYGVSYQEEIKRRYPTPVHLTAQLPTQRSDKNFVDIDPEKRDVFGIPQVRMHFEWDDNTLKMWEHSKVVAKQVLEKAGAIYEGHGGPELPGFSLHETGTCRMGNDAKHFVTNRFGQTHDVPNLFVCDASVLLNCTDKTTTLTILALSLRTSEYMVQQFKNGRFDSVTGAGL
jgi:choline dehydrogenase-like flavoprotein